MTGRDFRWRAAGGLLLAGGCAASLLDRGSPLTLLYFLGAILGIVLILNGKRVAIVWQAERRGHFDTAATIRDARVRRRRNRSGQD